MFETINEGGIEIVLIVEEFRGVRKLRWFHISIFKHSQSYLLIFILIHSNIKIKWKSKMFEDLTLMDYYYFSNKLWINANILLILPFMISCFCRFFNTDMKKDLWTDHFARFFLAFSWAFYIFDMAVKYPVDGADSVCEKAFFIHHSSSLIILPPLILNRYIPWWVSPIGFLHGLCIKFPEF